MIKNKKIHNLFKSWGKGKRKSPSNNDMLKREILAKIPTNFDKRILAETRHSRLIWLPFTFAGLALFVLFFNFTNYQNSVGRQNITQTESQIGSVPATDVYKSNNAIYPPSGGQEINISDKREFLKVGYDATLRTRNVTDLKNRVESVIRNLGGRVDSSSGGDKNGYISFVISKNNLESLKIEIKDLVPARFYNEQINSQNLLPEKQAIEESQKQTEVQLSNSQNEYAQIIGNHNKNISIYQGQIISKNTEINALNIEYQYTTAIRRAEIINRINQLQTEIDTIRSEIENENRNYQERINNINLKIKNTQENLKTIKQRDNNFVDNIATVNGSISLNWISLWEMVDAYLPGPLLVWIFLLAAIITFIWYRFSIRVLNDPFDFS